MSDSGLVGKVKLRSYCRENLNCIYAAIVRGKLEAAANFEHGKNVRNRRAFGKPLASRKGVGNPAQMDAIV